MTNTTPNENISDPVNHPSHYNQYPVEVIELTRHMSFTRGNAVKYIARAGHKGGPEKELEDLKKAKWYIEDDIAQLERKLAKKEDSNTKGESFNPKLGDLHDIADKEIEAIRSGVKG
jgi:hypothetical protein